MKIFALVMSAFYVLVGGVLVFTPALEKHIHSLRIPLGLVIIGYGVVRAYLWRRKYTDQTESE